MNAKPQVGEVWRARVSKSVVAVKILQNTSRDRWNSGVRSSRFFVENLTTGRKIDIHRNRLRERLDVAVSDEGSIVAFRALNEEAGIVLEENIGHAQRLGPQYCVEHRYAADIIRGLTSDAGLTFVRSREVE
jgi:hypothetical protein